MITCSYDKEFTVEVANAGTSEITSMTFEIAVAGGKTTEYEWTGNLPVYGITKIDLTAEIPFGEHQVTFDIVKANGESVKVNVGEDDNDPQFCVTDLLPHLAQEQRKS